MWITKLFYLLLTGIVYLFFCLYLPQFSAYLLVSMLLLPFGFFAAAHFGGAKLRAELFCTETQAEKGVPCRCVVQLHNPTWLPMGTVTLLLTVKNVTLNEETEQEFQTTVPPRDTIRMEIPVTPVHCGKFQVTVTNFRVYDSIHLFSHRKRLFRQTAFPVLPIVPEPPAQDYKPSVSGEAAVMQPTTEPEEFLGVRSYRSGDRMRAIHWKLSSRFPEPVVREYGIPRRVPAVIGMLYALQPPADGEPGTRLDAMLEALTAAVEMMCGSDSAVTVIICGDDWKQSREIASAAELLPFLEAILDMSPGSDPEAALSVLENTGDSVTCCIADTLEGKIGADTVFISGAAKISGQVSIAPETAAKTVYQTLLQAEGGER